MAGDAMHVGLAVYGGLGTTSGGFLYDRKLAAHLRERGHDVTVVALPDRGYLRSLADNLDPRIRHRLRGRGFDVLVEDELCHPSLVGHNSAVDAPVVTVVHHLRASERWPAWREALYRAVERRYLRTTDAAVYASGTTRRDAERLAGPRPSVVARPAGDRFDPDLGDREIAARAERDPFRVLFVGNLVPRKGLHVLLDGLARVSGAGTGDAGEATPGDGSEQTTDDWHLSVVGREADPEYARRARERARELGIRERVRFEGQLPDAALADRFAASHLLAVPSEFEGYGVAYLEGMGFGLPALATTAGGATELVTHGEDGLLVPPDDPEAVATAVETLLRDRDRLRELSLAARRRFERHPGWDESMSRVRRFLRSVVRNRETTADREATP